MSSIKLLESKLFISPRGADSSSLRVAMITTYGRRSSPPTSSTSPRTEDLACDYEKLLSPPPQSPSLSPPSTHQLMTKYRRSVPSVPSSPKPSTPIGQLEISAPCPEESPCDSHLSMVTDYGRRSRSPPPSPKRSPPPHQTTFLVQKLHSITSKSLLIGFNLS